MPFTTTSTSSTSTSTTSTSTTTTSTSITTTSTTTTSTSITTTSTSITTTSTSTSITTSTTRSLSTSVTISSTSTTSSSISTTTVQEQYLRKLCLPEADQVLVPVDAGTGELSAYPLLSWFGLHRGDRLAITGAGAAPSHFITQRGPYQDGETPIDMRFDGRTLQVVIGARLTSRADYWDRRNKLLDLLRPNRAFSETANEPQPCVYRRWLTGGKLMRGSDLRTEAGTAYVYSDSAGFVHHGVQAGAPLFITSGSNHGQYTVLEVVNDYTLRLDADMGFDQTTGWFITRRAWMIRDLYVVAESGPAFDESNEGSPYHPVGHRDVIQFVAHDPMWYGPLQKEDWGLLEAAANYGDLVFDGEGAWMGAREGVGRWLFLPSSVAGMSGSTNLVYWGTVPAKPTIYITGPATNPSIRNATVDKEIVFDYTVSAGEEVTVDTLDLLVYNNFGENLLHYVSGNLATFGLFPPPDAPNRINDVSVSFSGGSAGGSEVRIEWRNRYNGI
ncbi:MAG: hypothetical protein GF350_02330 [Chitinivibrionales bacterium]|nr:hypothetical protein [Chitinivibrionales bacterium]